MKNMKKTGEKEILSYKSNRSKWGTKEIQKY